MIADCCHKSTNVGSAKQMSSAYEIEEPFNSNDKVDIAFPVYGKN